MVLWLSEYLFFWRTVFANLWKKKNPRNPLVNIFCYTLQGGPLLVVKGVVKGGWRLDVHKVGPKSPVISVGAHFTPLIFG